MLGICYGLQLIAKLFGGTIRSLKKKENLEELFFLRRKNSLLLKSLPRNKNIVWMSHQDVVMKIPKGFKTLASTRESKHTVIENYKHKIYGVQFHPEVTHTENGKQILKNFIFLICKIKKSWRISSEKRSINQRYKKNCKKR